MLFEYILSLLFVIFSVSHCLIAIDNAKNRKRIENLEYTVSSLDTAVCDLVNHLDTYDNKRRNRHKKNKDKQMRNKRDAKAESNNFN